MLLPESRRRVSVNALCTDKLPLAGSSRGCLVTITDNADMIVKVKRVEINKHNFVQVVHIF